ncbi:MAG: hypothetical protein Q9M28_03695 [Mariprofundaceae bacterium]|nr:hypothetical protein [Mariprofundaceae bacterium]
MKKVLVFTIRTSMRLRIEWRIDVRPCVVRCAPQKNTHLAKVKKGLFLVFRNSMNGGCGALFLMVSNHKPMKRRLMAIF